MHKTIRFIFYNVIVVLRSLGALEWTLNYFMNHIEQAPKGIKSALRTYFLQRECNIIQYDSELAKYDSSLFYVLRPGDHRFRNRRFDTRFQVNSAGYRDHEGDETAPSIICLGDSHTMGWGVNQGLDFPTLLEGELDATVLNMGVSSYGIVRELKALEQVFLDSLDWLVIQYCYNDHYENQTFLNEGRYLPITEEQFYDQACANNRKNTKYFPGKHLLHLPDFLLKEKRKSTKKSEIEFAGKKRTYAPVEAFWEVLRKDSLIPPKAQILILDIESHASDNAFIDELKKRVQQDMAIGLSDRIHFLRFDGQLNASYRLGIDPHLNEAGHQLVAEKIGTQIRETDLFTGQNAWFYPDSKDTAMTCTYQNGLKHGTLTMFWENGNISRKENYQHGSLIAPAQNFDINGQIRSQ
ncbi:MAG: hypothetical protein AAFV80_11605 [Bacteroidota bacterium]